jgi:Ubiquitin carboxyl-terminal hydrolase, family 1
MGKKWLPLESNPAVLNEFAEKIGMTDSSYRFTDVFGLDPVCAWCQPGNRCAPPRVAITFVHGVHTNPISRVALHAHG